MISVFLSPGVRGVIVIQTVSEKIPLLAAQCEHVLLVLRSPMCRLIGQIVVCHHSFQRPGTAFNEHLSNCKNVQVILGCLNSFLT